MRLYSQIMIQQIVEPFLPPAIRMQRNGSGKEGRTAPKVKTGGNGSGDCGCGGGGDKPCSCKDHPPAPRVAMLPRGRY